MPTKNRSKNKAAIQDALKQIREYYRLGKRVLKTGLPESGRAAYGENIARNLAEELGVQPFRLYRARQFASEYDTKEFIELLKLRFANGMPLTRNHVEALLKVKDRHKRKALLSQVVKQGWSSNRLARLVTHSSQEKATAERYRNVGRLPRRPQNKREALQQIDIMSTRWKRWYKSLPRTKKNITKDCPIALTDLPPMVKKKLKEAVAAIEALHDAVLKSRPWPG